MDNTLQLSLDEQLPLRERVYKKLRDAILGGTFLPGERLIENSLAERMGVSRTPVREALQRLAQEGLVEIVPRKGVIVEGLSLEGIEEIFSIREVLEGLAGYLAATRVSAAQIKQLEEILAKGEEALERDSVRDFVRLNAEFHEAIVDAAGSLRLKELLNVVLNQISRYRHYSMTNPQRRRQSLPEHGQILESIRRKDPAAAEQALREHSRRAKEVVLEMARKELQS